MSVRKLHKVGHMDALHMRERFWSDLPYGIPRCDAFAGDLPDKWVSWPNRKHLVEGAGLHFFVDDYKFEPLFHNPDKYLSHMAGRVVCSPDFSIFREWPLAAQIWNTYRSRWMVTLLQDRGVRVIPTVTWGDKSSFDFCFLGIPKGSVVAISAYGATRVKERYTDGFTAMCDALEPSSIVCIGGKEIEAFEGRGVRFFKTHEHRKGVGT